MTTRRQFLRTAAGAAAAAGTLGVPHALRAQQREILIGETHPLTGALAREGNLGKQGIELAVNEINAAGGIKSMGGARIKLMVLDNESKPPVAISTMERFKDAGAVAVLGPYASGLAFVTTQEAEKYRIPHVLDVAVADAITERGFKYTFRFGPNAGMGAKWTVEYLGGLAREMTLNFKRVVLIHEDGLFGKSTADTLERLLPGIGMQVVERIPHSAAAPSLANEVLKIKAAKADVVIPSTYYPAHSLIMRTMAEQRVDVGAVISVYGGAGSQYRFIKDVGKIADYMLDGNHWYNPKHPRISGIIAAFEKAYQQPFAYEWMLAYQSVYVLRDALERAGAPDRDKVREALTKTSLRDQIVPYPISFDDKGQNPVARTLLMQVQGGKIAVVYPAEFAEAKPVLPVPAWGARP
ncbi:MAG TPA: ABC transporter substrate-binding protein [Methylomirabilota bacterium]|nr:ABC transporter substrate-binding protein [Methylomirabilota bacterium]